MTALLMTLLGLALAAAPPAGGEAAAAATTVPDGQCTMPAIRVEVDGDSLAAAGWSADPKRVELLRVGTMASIGRAYFSLCMSGKVAPALLAGKILLLQNGEGAIEPLFYERQEPPARLVFQYAFQNGPPPSADQAAHALICLAQPAAEDCVAGD